ncbi:amidohydrolase [Corynebacterium auriscanis]|uniref:amidohydrolase n=1 Tax=Corynebacterium auriscanis TaxID=99807 RepID=UPI003CF1B35E
MNPTELATQHGVDLSWQQGCYEWLHAHPELSLQEQETAAFIAQKLAEFDCDVTTGIGGHGIVAIFRNGHAPEGKTILMRADFDALPVTEDTGLPYSSTNEGVMHACGHDMHTSALLGVCAVMDARRDAWEGTFIALFQPAEEVTRGAGMMIEDGLADKIPTPDVCLGQHIVAGPVGTVMSAPGPVLAACDTITITLFGKSAHGSQPHESLDPTFVAAMIVVRLQGIVGREVSPEDFAVITVGTLSSGNTNNTIPDHAKLVLNCRFYDTGVRDKTYKAIERVIRGECYASGCERDPIIEYSAHGELTDNDQDVFDTVRPHFDATFGEKSVTAERWTASEDFSEIPRHFGVPYLFWTVGVTNEKTWNSGNVPGNHSPHFAPAPGALEAATKAGITAVAAYLAH